MVRAVNSAWLSSGGVLVLVSSLWLSGCGHPATKEECAEILNKVIELEARSRKVNDPTALAARVDETRKAESDKLLPLCENRRITNAAMACIRAATSVDQITGKCLQ